jgi:carboxymethylenebutenolidase
MGMTTFKRTDGAERGGYLAKPSANASGVGLVIAHELWGVDSAICQLADRCAAAGHVAFVPDLFQGKLPQDIAEGFAAMGATDMTDAVTNDLAGAAAMLKGEGLRVGLFGLCYGGALAIAGAVRISALGAAICFYGVPEFATFDPAQIRVPLQCHFAHRDTWCTPDKAQALEQRLKAGNVDYEIHRYEADHAFMNPTGTGYSAENALVAWQRSMEFIERRLGKA